MRKKGLLRTTDGPCNQSRSALTSLCVDECGAWVDFACREKQKPRRVEAADGAKISRTDQKPWATDPSWIDSVHSVYSVVQTPEFLTTECADYTE